MERTNYILMRKMMMSALYQTNTLNWIFKGLVN